MLPKLVHHLNFSIKLYSAFLVNPGKFDHNILMVTFEVRPTSLALDTINVREDMPDDEKMQTILLKLKAAMEQLKSMQTKRENADGEIIKNLDSVLTAVLTLSRGSSRRSVPGQNLSEDDLTSTLSPQSEDAAPEPNHQLLHCRCEGDFSKRAGEHTVATLRKMVGAMAKDALGMPAAARKPDYNRARNQPWWPKDVPKDAVISRMNRDELIAMYINLKDFLRIGDYSARPTAPTSNIQIARGLLKAGRELIGLS
jgi:hypothetical protein